MNSADATLEAIIANPTDNTLRLEYADAADLAGDHDKALFIRLQCELEDRWEDLTERESLKKRIERLQTQYDRKWAQPLLDVLPSLDPGFDFHFRRGFVEDIKLSPDDFLAHAHEIFARAPIRFLVLSEIRHQLGDIVECRILSRLEVLAIESRRRPLEPSEIALLVQSPHLYNLSGLGLTGHRVFDEGAAAISASPRLKNLKRLFLNEAMIGDRGVEYLSASPHLTSLLVLNLQGNLISNEGAKALIASSGLRSLRELYLDSWSEVFDPVNPRNPISLEWQRALLDHFGPATCSFSPEPLFKASLIG